MLKDKWRHVKNLSNLFEQKPIYIGPHPTWQIGRSSEDVQMRFLQAEGSGSKDATLCKKSRLVFAKSLSFKGWLVLPY